MDVHTLVQQLRGLPDEQLLDVLQQVFATRQPDPEERAYNENRYFLGTASKILEADNDRFEQWGDWEIAAVAYLDRAHYPFGTGPEWGFCQRGTCATCGIAVRSNVKHGLCPICGTKVYMS